MNWIDVVLMILTVVTFNVIPDKINALMKYALVTYLLLKYIWYVNGNRTVFALLGGYTLALSVSTVLNTGDLLWMLSALMSGLQLMVLFLVSVAMCQKIGKSTYIHWLIQIFFVLLVVNDLLFFFMPYDFSNADESYLLGNKFLVVYYHCFFSCLVFLKLAKQKKVLWGGVLFVLCAIVALRVSCSTGVIMAAVLIAMMFAPWKARNFLKDPKTLMGVVAVENLLIWSPMNIFQSPLVQFIIVNVFHKSANMSGRSKLYAATMGLVEKKPLLGYGHNTDIYRFLFGYGNAQNGLFHIVIQAGILGAALYFAAMYVALRRKKKENNRYEGYMYLFAMAVVSAIEINLSLQFMLGVALLYGLNEENWMNARKGVPAMKIGIMSMQRIANYGSFMQAYSLKKMIESLGHEVVFVDYKIEPSIENRYNKKEIVKCWLNTQKKFIKSIPLGKWLFQKLKKEVADNQAIMFACNDMLGITDRYVYRTKVDTLVIGSDEVFNCLQPGYTVGYSLELFGKNNRAQKVMTYAASFGTTTLERLKAYGVKGEIGDCLCKMAALSARDANSYYLIETLCERQPELHLDPVLVGGLEHAQWTETDLRDYVILYGYENRFTEEECRAVMDFAHKNNKIVVALGEKQPICDHYIRCMPHELMSYFKHASYVVTDTFHGTIFSVINHRSFLTLVRGGNTGNSQKLQFLLEQLGLQGRQLQNLQSMEYQMTEPIDYASVDALRAQEREKSLAYLQNNLL